MSKLGISEGSQMFTAVKLDNLKKRVATAVNQLKRAAEREGVLEPACDLRKHMRIWVRKVNGGGISAVPVRDCHVGTLLYELIIGAKESYVIMVDLHKEEVDPTCPDCIMRLRKGNGDMAISCYPDGANSSVEIVLAFPMVTDLGVKAPKANPK